VPQGELPQREERRRKPFLFLCGLSFPQGRLHREKKNFFVFFAKKRFFIVFLLSVEVLLEADPNDFLLTIFSFFSLILSSLCVFYPRGRSDCIKSENNFVLVFLLSVEAV
jgi:hypothetical protein